MYFDDTDYAGMEGFCGELLYIMSGDGVGIPKVNMFVSSAKFTPAGSGPYLTIVETGGTSPDNTQDQTVIPAYQRPGAQLVCRAKDYAVAKTMAKAAYRSLVKINNTLVGSGIVSATGAWYRKIRPLQEPFDLGLDAEGRARCAFNVLGDKRPS